jgi:hypothetical membrane protein
MSHDLRTGAGVLFVLAGSGILMGVITAEALYPAAYRTDANTISDLGGTRPPDSVVYQPSAAIFDATMLVSGLMIIIAAVLVRRGLGRGAAAIPTALLGIGVLGVGVFPGNTGPHPLFAMVAFVSGGCAAIGSFRVVASPLRYLCLGYGVVALTALAAGLFLLEWSPVAALGEGGVERWIAYPVVLWLVSYGAQMTVPGSRGDAARQLGDASGGQREVAAA